MAEDWDFLKDLSREEFLAIVNGIQYTISFLTVRLSYILIVLLSSCMILQYYYYSARAIQR